ncbi:MAG TPA: DUF6691 family protein [Sedimentisphaerales bacterium]|nr:DUF6691 family protein [Sedimentisphaerales bacterium]
MSTPIVGLIMGVIFGTSLVLTGLTNPDKIIGALRLKDFYAIRTVAVFLLVAMLGTWILDLFGAANFNIKPAVILTVLIGGAFLGTGLGLTGFSPATGLASAASGRIDALITVIGMIFGAHVYILIYPSIVVPLEKVLNFGSLTLPQITGSSAASWVVPIFAAGSFALFITRSRKPRDDEQRIKAGDLGMNEEFPDPLSPIPIPRQKGLYLKSDCLKAASVFRRWKNLLFMVMLLCLLLHQASFWLVSTGQVEITENTNPETPVVLGADSLQADQSGNSEKGNAGLTDQAAAPAEESRNLMLFGFDVTFELLTSIVRITNIILVLTSVLYALIMYFGLGISFKGGLGGLAHICGALYMALIIFVLLLPWQNFFGPIAMGATYTPNELVSWCTTDISDTLGMVLFYLRFTGYWALVMLLLLLAQLRSFRWARAIIR